MKKAYESILKEVAERNGYTYEFVSKVYRSYWTAIREYIKNLPLKEDLTDNEFNELRPNINIPSIGKLYITLERYHKMKNHAKAK